MSLWNNLGRNGPNGATAIVCTSSAPKDSCRPLTSSVTVCIDSDLICLQLPMKQMIVLGSLKVATDLLDKRSHLYSDRIYFPAMDL